MKRFFTYLFSLLFPRTCPICGCAIEDNETICRHCLLTLPRTEQAILRDNMTEELFRDIPNFVRAAAFLFFQKGASTQRLVHAIKYAQRPDVAYAIAKEAAADFINTDFFDEIDVIMPIPLHKRRLRQRGYNQSFYIAKALSDVTGIPMDTTHITRIVNNPKQALMRGKQREENVKGIFQANHPEMLYHKHILLVDDLITTGNTIRSCIKTMKAFRGCQVSVFALGKAV